MTKKKHKEFEPSGRGSRAAQRRADIRFAKWQRRHKGISEDQSLDPQAETPLGQLFLSKKITKLEFYAGRRYRDAVYRYRIVMGLPTELPSTMGIRGVDNYEFPEEQIQQAKRIYTEMLEVLNKTGKHVQTAVHTCCVTERVDDPELIKRGLKALRLFYGEDEDSEKEKGDE